MKSILAKDLSSISDISTGLDQDLQTRQYIMDLGAVKKTSNSWYINLLGESMQIIPLGKLSKLSLFEETKDWVAFSKGNDNKIIRRSGQIQ